MKKATVALLAILSLAACGEESKPEAKPTPTPSPAHIVKGDVGGDWTAENSTSSWHNQVQSVEWLDDLPWILRIDVSDGTSVETAIDICRTGNKFFRDHTEGIGNVVWVYDSRGKLAQTSGATCREI